MKYKDQFATDGDGKKFIFTVEMQRLLFERGDEVTAESWVAYRKDNAPKAAPDPKKKKEKKAAEKSDDAGENVGRDSAELSTDDLTGKFIGTLLSFNDSKGFGFISHGEDDLYFHRKKALDDPKYFSVGQKLLYAVNMYRGKEEAVDVEEYEEPID